MTVDLKIDGSFHPDLKRFIREVYDLVQQKKDEETTTKEILQLMKPLLTTEGIIDEKYMQPGQDSDRLYKLYVAPDESFSIGSAVWDKGQCTPIHDHGTWGVIGVIQGVEIETHYHRPKENKIGPLKSKEVHILKKGEALICCTSDEDVHDVRSGYVGEPCVGLHVYGGDIGKIKRNVFNPITGEKSEMITPWDYAT